MFEYRCMNAYLDVCLVCMAVYIIETLDRVQTDRLLLRFFLFDCCSSLHADPTGISCAPCVVLW